MQADGIGATGSQKQKTTKAERRAIQEAQRAAKAAAKEAGDKSSYLHVLLYSFCRLKCDISIPWEWQLGMPNLSRNSILERDKPSVNVS